MGSGCAENSGRRGRRPMVALPAIAAAVLAMALAAPASAHIERASYFPDPGVDFADGKPAGGAVPAARSLFTAADPSALGDTRVVCPGGTASVPKPRVAAGSKAAKLRKKLKRKLKKAKAKHQRQKVKRLKRKLKKLKAAVAASDQSYQNALRAHPSIKALQASIADAKANGYKVRPKGITIRFEPGEAEALLALNLKLLQACAVDNIQDAVNASHNNDRVVVMPGLYTEPKSRARPSNDPACEGLEEMNDRPGGGGSLQTGALSYRYQAACPNDQNLITVIGREPGSTPPPQPPLLDRHGIPDNGPCVRCNLQIEGSGVSADDVVVDAGRVASGNGGPPEPVKDIGIRAERADGFVLRNVTVRHAAEHGIYVVETDGYRLERFKAFYNEEYGLLTFTGDHALVQTCETAGSGDAGLYPGSAADVGEQTTEPGGPRYGTEVRYCDMHHNAAGFSGTAANAIHLHDNDIYDNALGLTTDVFTAAGHPGFPQDSDLIENNRFFDNNFNPYVDQPAETEIVPTIPVPVGTGMWIAGGNNNVIRNNRFWDNWRRATMLFAVPDAFVCGNNPIANGNQQAGCSEGSISTSYRNRFHNNVMGQDPAGAADPNGVDFWWDQFPANTQNCWYGNVGPDGTRASLTSTPPQSPVAGTSLPLFLPEDCATSVGTSGAPQEVELLGCLAEFDQGIPAGCPWFTTPPEPQP